MTYPVTGPFTETINRPLSSGLGTGRSQTRIWSRQKRPFDLTLPFIFQAQQCIKESGYVNYDDLNAAGGSDTIRLRTANPDLQDAALNLCLARFQGKIAEGAMWALNYAERRQAIASMESRLFQLVRFTRAINRFDFPGAARSLLSTHDRDGWSKYRALEKSGKLIQWRDKRGRLRKKRTAGTSEGMSQTTARHAANNYLEFHFGWSPLVSDIHNTITTLLNGVPPVEVKASAKKEMQETVGPIGYDPFVSYNKYYARCKVGCRIHVDNPNLWLINQLGVLNPAVLAFELVKFSFISDWFVNINQVLSSWTDYEGLAIHQPYHTESYGEDREWYWPGVTSGRKRSIFIRRREFLPTPVLRVKPPWRLSPRRGAAAASLLVQLMPKPK